MSDAAAVLVLVVDDEALVLDLIVSAVEDGGYATIDAISAEEAFAILDERGPELGGIVTDVNLGRGQPSGWDVARRGRELCPSIPVVYVTGDSAHGWTSHGVPHSLLVQKPFGPAHLVVALASLRKVE